MFTVLSNVLIAVVCCALAYVAFTRIGQRFFVGRRRAEVAAIAMLATFGIGYLVGHRVETSTASTSTSAIARTSAAAPAPLFKPRDVSAECDRAIVPQPGGNGNVDVLLRASVAAPVRWDEPLERVSAYTLIGWGVARSKTDRALAACLVVDGRPARGLKSYYGNPRPDVAALFNTPADTYSGFTLEIPPKYLSAGPHTLQVAVESPDRSMHFAAGTHTVIVH